MEHNTLHKLTTALAAVLVALSVSTAAAQNDLEVDNMQFHGKIEYAGPVVLEVPTSGMIAHYAFTTAATPVPDDSGNEHVGSLNGATWSASGKEGGAYSFDGIDDYIDIGTLGIDNSDGWSLCAWIKVNTTDQSVIFACDLPSYHDDVMFGVCPGSGGALEKLGVAHHNDNGYLVKAANDPSTVTIGSWVHVVATYDKANFVLYVDGEQVAQQPVADTSGMSASQTKYIGKNPQVGGYFDGLIDELIIYSRGLSPSEVEGLYGHYVPPAPDPNAGTITAKKVDTEELFINGVPFVALDGTVTPAGNIALNGKYISSDGQDTGIFVDAGGNVGVGTASPLNKLHVDGDVRMEGVLRMYDPDGSGGESGQTYMYAWEDAGWNRIDSFAGRWLTQWRWRTSARRAMSVTASDANGARMELYDGDDQSAVYLSAEGLSYLSGGNVGIGTTTPMKTLEVNGTAKITGETEILDLKPQGDIPMYGE